MLYHPSDVDGGMERTRHHADAMYLDVIRPLDVPRGKIPLEKQDWLGLKTDDIDGAAPKYLTQTLFATGPPPKDPIRGCHPRKPHTETSRGAVPDDLSLTTGDIDKCQPNVSRFKTRRVIDPLTPQYLLPSVTMIPHDVPKARYHEGAVRDTLDFKGYSNPLKFVRNYQRDPNEIRDIELSQANINNRKAKLSGSFTPRDTMRTIERAGERVLSSKVQPDSARESTAAARSSCPLDPTYRNPMRTTHPFRRGEETDTGLLAPRIAGPVDGAAPRVLHRDNGEPQASLMRRDVGGAVPQRYKGGTPFNIYDAPEVTPFYGHIGLDCSDIPGAQPGTRKPGTM